MEALESPAISKAYVNANMVLEERNVIMVCVQKKKKKLQPKVLSLQTYVLTTFMCPHHFQSLAVVRVMELGVRKF